MRRWLGLVACVVLGLGVGAPAFAADPEPVGPSGSTFDGTTVVCGHDAPPSGNILDEPIVYYSDARGLEVCSEELGTRVFLGSNERPTIGPYYGVSWVHADVANEHVVHVPITP